MSDDAADTTAVGCTIRTLPPELIMEAAAAACDIYPANRPAVAQFASTFEGTESDVLPVQFIAALTSRYWGPKPRTIPVQFLDAPDAETIRLILAHANAWDCGVVFAHTQGQGTVRVSRSGGGYWSYLGTDVAMIPAGQPTMNLQGFTSRTSLSEYRRVVTHEFGHTLGFPHEHMRRELVERLDRPATIAYFGRTQGWSPRDVALQVLTPLDETTLMGTPADSDSIMCYQIPGECTRDGLPIRGGDEVNGTDLAFADTIYPKADSPVVPPTPPPVEPPPIVKPPEPPPVKPPDGEIMGPYDLALGKESKSYRMGPNQSFVFRVKVPRKGDYAAATRSKLDLKMDLYDDEDQAPIASDDDAGQGGNPLISARLTRGMHTLVVKGAEPTTAGPFKVRCTAI